MASPAGVTSATLILNAADRAIRSSPSRHHLRDFKLPDTGRARCLEAVASVGVLWEDTNGGAAAMKALVTKVLNDTSGSLPDQLRRAHE